VVELRALEIIENKDGSISLCRDGHVVEVIDTSYLTPGELYDRLRFGAMLAGLSLSEERLTALVWERS
jgi:hypothetical protein